MASRQYGRESGMEERENGPAYLWDEYLFYSSAYLPVTAKDEEGRYVYSNEANNELMRVSWKDLKGTTARDYFSEKLALRMEALDKATRESGPQFSETQTMGTGYIHPFHIKVPYLTPDGRILVVGTVFDSFGQFSFLHGWRLFAPGSGDQSSNLGFWGLAFQFGQYCINSDLCELIGLPKEKAGFGHRIQNYIHPKDLPEFSLGLARLIRGEIRQITYQVRMKAPDNSDWQWMMGLAVASVRAADFEPLIVAGVVWNVTHQMQLQEESRRRQLLFTSIYDQSPMGVMVLNEGCRVNFINQYLKNAFGLDRDSVPDTDHGTPLDSFFPSDQAGEVEAHAREVLETGCSRNSETEVFDASGKLMTLASTWFPLCDNHGHINAVGCVSLDVTHIKRVESRVSELENILNERQTFGGFRGNSEVMQQAYFQLRHMAKTDATVLILGESGTGKELAAEALHYESPRAKMPLVKVNCAALTESLLESELFGHVRGSFSGAFKDRVGRFAAAEGGTLFLDEVGDLPLNFQVKLLRFMDRREYERVGESMTRRADVRIIAATNADLQAKVLAGQFRSDFYFRLSALRVTLPPLRERGQDIINIAQYFIDEHCRAHNHSAVRLHREVIRFFLGYPWPGNVRELRNVIDYALIFAGGREIRMEHLPPMQADAGEQAAGEGVEGSGARVSNALQKARRFPRSISRAEADQAVKDAGGNKRLAAQRLGISRTSLYSLLGMNGKGKSL